MQAATNLNLLVTGAAFVLGFVFGAVGNRARFCTMGAVADIVTFGDWRRMRMWMLAIAVAIAGSTALQSAGLIDLGKSIYTGPRVAWLSAIVGGLLFGIGMTLASGCGARTLIRIGGGSVKSLVVLVFTAVSAFMTLKGLFAVWRVNALDAVRFDVATLGAATSDLPALGAALGLGGPAKAWLGYAVAALIGAWVFRSREFRGAGKMIAASVVIGAVIVGGWYVTGHLGYVAEDPQTLEEKFVATYSGRAESFSFIGPLANLLEWLVLWTDQSRTLTFGIAAVLGVAAGSAVAARRSRSFRWEGFASVGDLGNHIVGGILMGFGGVTALGCTIGQGLSGVSTLALGSFVALASIIAGSVLALRYHDWRLGRAS